MKLHEITAGTLKRIVEQAIPIIKIEKDPGSKSKVLYEVGLFTPRPDVR